MIQNFLRLVFSRDRDIVVTEFLLTLSAPEDLGDVKLNYRVRLKSHVKKFQIGGSRSWRTISFHKRN